MNEFKGFESPEENWSKLPHQLIDELPRFSSLGELKVVLYVLRHTWGYKNDAGIPDEYKRITLDEFENGRKRKDGTRIDSGVGMTKPTIINGTKRAIKDGFLFVHKDDTDSARTKKYYSLTVKGLKSFTPDVKEFNPSSKESLHRTEKETKKETKKDIAPEKSDAPKPPLKPDDPSKQGDTQTDEKEPKARKRDILFDGIVAKGFKIDPVKCSKEQLAAIAGRVGKIKSRLIKINPAFKELNDDEIRNEVNAFWNWYTKQYDFDETNLRSDVKWGEYYLQYHQSGNKTSNGTTTYFKATETDEPITESDRQAALDALKGDNQKWT